MGALIDDFESYNDGDLNGQGDWSGDAAFDVQTAIKHSGSKAVECDNESHTWRQIVKSFVGGATGKQIWWVYFSMNGGSSGDEYTQTWLNLVDGAIGLGGIRVGGGYIQLWFNSEVTPPGYYNLVSDPTINTWYKLEVEWNASTDSIRGRVNDGAWSNWYQTSAFTDVDGLQFAVRQSHSFVDDFADGSAPVTNIKSVEGVAYASIKKISGVAIASVKKVAGVT